MKCIPVKYPKIDFGDRYVINRAGYMYDTTLHRSVREIYGASHGYPFVYLYDVNGVKHALLLHRIVAYVYIGDIDGFDVHHKNRNKYDRSISNLEIKTRFDHHHEHTVGENSPCSILTDEDVHCICKMLKDGITHISIQKKLGDRGKSVSLSAIDKIAAGVNWAHISRGYNIRKKDRETMNEFSKLKTIIGRLIAIDGFTIHQVADMFGIEYATKRYARFEKCAKRYADKYATTTYYKFTGIREFI